MRALVTGGAGFIGSTLVDRLLAEGHEVDVLDDLSTGKLANLADARSDRAHKVTFHQFDVRDPQLVDLIARRSPEVIHHLAAQIDVRESVADPAHDAEVNVVGTINVLEGARRAGTRKVVYASSGGKPMTPHGISKRVALDYLNLYREMYDVEFTALALANVYGPRQEAHGDAGVVAIFAGRLLADEACTIHGDGGQTRDYVYVDDAVDAFVRAASKGGGLVLNVGTGVETSVKDLYATMSRAAGVDRPAAMAPSRPGEQRRSALDPSRAAIHLGWKPWTGLEDGVTKVLDWCKLRS